jgi:hypothetical protein
MAQGHKQGKIGDRRSRFGQFARILLRDGDGLTNQRGGIAF